MDIYKITLEKLQKELEVLTELAEEDQEIHSWSRLKQLKEELKVVLRFFNN